MKILCNLENCIHHGCDGVCKKTDSLNISDKMCSDFEAVKITEQYKNTVVLPDSSGRMSVMVRIPKFKYSDIIAGGADKTVSAFIVNGKEVDEIYISKYQNVIIDGKAYSLPMKEPATNIDFDEAVKACEAKGKGWHLMTNAEWSAIALWCKKNGTLPHGNNSFGKDYKHTDETGIKYDNYRVLTGSGPATWSHDHTIDGIYDLNGNIFEWVSGVKTVDGKIMIIENNDAAVTPDSNWKPIEMSDGNYVHFETGNEDLELSNRSESDDYNGCKFVNLKTTSNIPDILKELAIAPYGDEEKDMEGYVYVDAEGERYCCRGGYYYDYAYAGVFEFRLGDSRSGSSDRVGFRSAFVNL